MHLYANGLLPNSLPILCGLLQSQDSRLFVVKVLAPLRISTKAPSRIHVLLASRTLLIYSHIYIYIYGGKT